MLVALACTRVKETTPSNVEHVRQTAGTPRKSLDHSLVALEAELGGRVEAGGPMGIRESVHDLAFSPDGNELALTDGNELVVLNARGMTEQLRWRSRHGWVMTLAYSPKGNILASASLDGTLALWDPKDGSLLRELSLEKKGPSTLAFSVDGRWLAAGSALGRLLLVDLSTNDSVRPLDIGKTGVSSLVFSPDGKLLVVGDTSNLVRLFRLADGKEQKSAKGESSIRSLAVADDGSLVAWGEQDEGTFLWEPASGRALPLPTGTDTPRPLNLGFSPDRVGLWAVTDDKSLWRFSTVDRRPMSRHMLAEPGDLRVAAWDAARTRVAIATDVPSVSIWQTDGAKRLGTLGSASAPIRCLAMSQDGAHVATGAKDGLVRLYSLGEGPGLRSLAQGGEVEALAFSSDSSLLATGGSDGGVALWRVSDGQRLGTLIEPRAIAVRSLRFLPQSDILVAASYQAVRTWRVTDGQRLARVETPDDPIKTLDVSGDGRLLVTNGARGKVTLWDPLAMRRTGTLELGGADIDRLRVSADGRLLWVATVGGGTQLWDLGTRQLVYRLESSAGDEAIAFDPTSSRVARGLVDGTVHLHGTSSPKEKAVIAPPRTEKGISDLAFSPDGRWLLASSYDGAVKYYDLRDLQHLVSTRALFGSDAAYVTDAHGRLELLGTALGEARKRAFCRLGTKLYPFARCQGERTVAGLLVRALGTAGPAHRPSTSTKAPLDLASRVRPPPNPYPATPPSIPCGKGWCHVGTELCCDNGTTATCVPRPQSEPDLAELERLCKLSPDASGSILLCGESTDCGEYDYCCRVAGERKDLQQCLPISLRYAWDCFTPPGICLHRVDCGAGPEGCTNGHCAAPTAEVSCGNQICKAPNQVCCVKKGRAPRCTGADACRSGEAGAFRCDGRMDCPSGMQCCLEYSGGSYCGTECVDEPSLCESVSDCPPRMAGTLFELEACAPPGPDYWGPIFAELSKHPWIAKHKICHYRAGD